MTMQASDSVRYKKKVYTLVDCTSNLIATADFGIMGSDVTCTACYRGYTAEYSVKKNVLYGVKHINGFLRLEGEELESDWLKMNFTGSILIAKPGERYFNSDFIDSYLFADIAYELRFEDGVLQEEISLSEAIKEWKEMEVQIDKENAEKVKQGIYEDEYEGYRRKADIREEFARKHLKYKYCDYKWKTKG